MFRIIVRTRFRTMMMLKTIVFNLTYFKIKFKLKSNLGSEFEHQNWIKFKETFKKIAQIHRLSLDDALLKII